MSSLHSKSSTKVSSVVLYRRLLFPDLPPTASPPPILPHASAELNTELYDLTALALRAYITPWWSKITRYNSDFIPHVAFVLSEVVRALAARLEAADAMHLVLRAFPTIVAQHYADYRAAAAKVGSAYACGGAATLPQLFHQYQNHMGIDADGPIDPTYVRHLLDLILQACLPVEDQESDAERAIIREVIAKVLVNDVVPMLCQPWFIHKIMLDQLRSGQEASASSVKATEPPPARSSNPSFHTGVVFILSTVQYLSGLCLVLIHWYKQALNVVKRVNATPELPRSKGQREFAMSLLRCASEVLNVRSRMASSVIFDVLESLLKFIENFTDRLLVYILQTYVMTEQRVITVVKLSKQTLFPNGYPGPPLVIPTPEEQIILKEQLVRQFEERVPSIISRLILGPGPMSRETIVDALEPLSSEACNAHLILFLLDLIVLTLFPELGVQAPAEDEASSGEESTRTDLSPEPEGEARGVLSEGEDGSER